MTPNPERTDAASLVERLRGVYRVPITDGLGPAGGEEPDNANEFVRTFPVPPIHKEAAEEITRLRSLLEKARDGLVKLDAVFDFSEPYESDEFCEFDDTSAVNEAFATARALHDEINEAMIQPPETPARPSADTAPEADCEVVRLQAEIDKYRNCFAELTAKAAPYGSGPADDMHKISSYVIPAGPLHRAAGQVEGQWFDGITHLAQAQADAAAYRDALEEIAEHPGVTADDSAHLRAGIARDALKRPDPQPAESAELWAVDGYPTLDPWNRTGEAEMERKSIVAWLRNDDAVAAALHAETGPLNFRRFYATAIERGDHLTPPEPREKP